jgi:hypothetical protein
MTLEISALVFAAVMGFVIAGLVDPEARGSLLAGESILLGVGAAAFVLLALSIVHVPWSPPALIIGLVVIAMLCTPWKRKIDVARPRFPLAAWPFIVLTIVLVAGYSTFATMAPLWEFDFIGDWGLKARAFFTARGIDWNFLEHPFHHDIHPDYPPLLPLAFDLLAVMRGAWNDQASGLISVAFAIGLLLVVHCVARQETESPIAAAFITAAMVPLACSPWIGLAEGPLVAYVTTAVLLLRWGRVTPAGVLLGLAASTKNEGLTFIVAVVIALAVTRRAREIPRLWPAVAIPLPWMLLRFAHHLSTDIAEGNVATRVAQHLGDPMPLLTALARYPVGKPLFWIGVAVALIVLRRELFARERLALLVIAIQFAFYIGAYLASPHDLDWHLKWSWERLVSHLAPLLAFVLLVHLFRHHPLHERA